MYETLILMIPNKYLVTRKLDQTYFFFTSGCDPFFIKRTSTEKQYNKDELKWWWEATNSRTTTPKLQTFGTTITLEHHCATKLRLGPRPTSNQQRPNLQPRRSTHTCITSVLAPRNVLQFLSLQRDQAVTTSSPLGESICHHISRAKTQPRNMRPTVSGAWP